MRVLQQVAHEVAVCGVCCCICVGNGSVMQVIILSLICKLVHHTWCELAISAVYEGACGETHVANEQFSTNHSREWLYWLRRCMEKSAGLLTTSKSLRFKGMLPSVWVWCVAVVRLAWCNRLQSAVVVARMYVMHTAHVCAW